MAGRRRSKSRPLPRDRRSAFHTAKLGAATSTREQLRCAWDWFRGELDETDEAEPVAADAVEYLAGRARQLNGGAVR
jgi:hypothetical protein